MGMGMSCFARLQGGAQCGRGLGQGEAAGALADRSRQGPPRLHLRRHLRGCRSGESHKSLDCAYMTVILFSPNRLAPKAQCTAEEAECASSRRG